MSEGQLVAIGWGIFAVAFGTFFVINRRRISEKARVRRGSGQTPGRMAAAGGFCVVVGVLALVGGMTGVLS